MAQKKKKSHGLRNFFLFVIICTCLVFILQKIMIGVFPFQYTEYVDRYAEKYQLDRAFVFAIIKTESNFNPDAQSASGAKGLMQLTDATAGDCSKILKISDYSEDKIYDPETNIYMGCYYFSYLLERFDGEVDTALAAYNAGEGNVRAWLSDSRYSSDGKTLQKIPFPETEKYVKKVHFHQQVYEVMGKWFNMGKK